MACSPGVAVVPNPIKERFFEADIVSDFFGFQPFVFQDLFSLRQKLLVESGIFGEVTSTGAAITRGIFFHLQ